jgi:Uma2 family endonuclease
MPLPKEEKKYTYADYLIWSEDERWEIIDGIPYMQAAPSWQHQSISGELYRQISNHLISKPCRVFAAPFDLCLVEYDEQDESIDNVVQPDVVVVCDEKKLRKTGYFGVPTLVIEILSPATSRRDRVLKMDKMQVSEPTQESPGGTVIYRSGLNPKIGRNFQIYSPCDFIASITQHIPDKSFQLVRYYGWYSNKMRGQREKEKVNGTVEQQSRAVEIIDVSEEKRRRKPSPLRQRGRSSIAPR